jgi:hypothetical protein
MRAAVLAVALFAVCPRPGLAQPPEPIAAFVVDLRGVMAGLPSATGWTPILPPNSSVPGRGFGFEGGAHVYLKRLGPTMLGIGGAVVFAQGRSTAIVEGTPDVTTRLTSIAPQLSFNFGRRLGWSHLSLGYGGVRLTSESTAVDDVPAARAEPGLAGAVNVGGGARWFISEHIGVGFDARWHIVSSRPAQGTLPAAPGDTLFNLAVGLSIR